MHDVCTICVNYTELDTLCEFGESCVLNKGVDEVSDKVLSGVMANLWWEAGSCFGKSDMQNRLA